MMECKQWEEWVVVVVVVMCINNHRCNSKQCSHRNNNTDSRHLREEGMDNRKEVDMDSIDEDVLFEDVFEGLKG